MTSVFFTSVTVGIFVSFYRVGEGLREELVLRSELEFKNFHLKYDFEFLLDLHLEHSGSNCVWTQELGGCPLETEAGQPDSITSPLNFYSFNILL